jgi:small subunit ribosomal protein S20
MSLRSRVRSQIKNVVMAIEAGDKEAAQAGYKAAVPTIDNMVGKGIIHKNKAARHKSRLNTKIRAMTS